MDLTGKGVIVQVRCSYCHVPKIEKFEHNGHGQGHAPKYIIGVVVGGKLFCKPHALQEARRSDPSLEEKTFEESLALFDPNGVKDIYRYRVVPVRSSSVSSGT